MDANNDEGHDHHFGGISELDDQQCEHHHSGSNSLPLKDNQAESKWKQIPEALPFPLRRKRIYTKSPSQERGPDLQGSPLVTPPLAGITSSILAIGQPPRKYKQEAEINASGAGALGIALEPQSFSCGRSSGTHNNKRGVPHVYHDFGHVPDGLGHNRKKTGGVTQPFPEKLHDMLDTVDTDQEAKQTVSWLSHGRAFLVHKPKEFTHDIMPRFFRQTKLTSFQRQLNLYGFRRITQGPDAGAYYHEMFLRARPGLCQRMVRQKVKGTGHKQPADASSEPNFYTMERLDESNIRSTLPHISSSSSFSLRHPSDKYDNSDATWASPKAFNSYSAASKSLQPNPPPVHGFAFTAQAPPDQLQSTVPSCNTTSFGEAAVSTTCSYDEVTMSPGVDSLRGAAHLLQHISSMRPVGQPIPTVPLLPKTNPASSSDRSGSIEEGPMATAKHGFLQQREPELRCRRRLKYEWDETLGGAIVSRANDLSPSSENSEARNVRSV